jgi:YHS domain-containing protein
MTSIRRLGWTALTLFALAGCEPATPTTPATPPTTGEPKAPTKIEALSVEPTKPEVKLSDAETEEIKRMADEDQKIALAQMVCPVTNAHLGKMGQPVKQVVEGKTFFLCCSDCEEEVKADPKGVLAKLKK